MSLYRKYRPQTFEDVVGQEHIARTLRNALRAAPLRVAHAYLFCGPRGTGKTTTARLLAKCLNCENGPTPTPCNECDFCVRVRDNQPVMDLLEIDAASNTGVDHVRDVILDKVNLTPAQGRYRVYIIDEVHMLSASSFNALLKTLEEPPAHAIFVLATTDAHKVPATITSRCQRFDFRRVGPRDIVSRLQYVAGLENTQLSEGAALLIARSADGALRDALTLLEQVTAFSAETISEADVRLVLGTVSQELLLSLMDAVATGDAAEALRQIERATEEGVSFSQVTRDLTQYCREVMLLAIGYEGDSTLSEAEREARHRHARQLGRDRLMACVEALRAADKDMRQSTDNRLLLELTLVRAAAGTLPPAIAAAPEPQVAGRRPMAPPTPPRQPAAPPRAARPAPEPPAPQPWAEPPFESADRLPGAQEQLPARPEGRAAAAPSPEPDAGVGEIESDRIAADPDVAEAALSAGESDAARPSGAERAPAKKRRYIHNLEEFQELWPFVLMRLKKKIGVAAGAYLHDARPVAFDDSDAVLEFAKPFHHDMARDAAKRLPFEKVFNECTATPHRLRFRLQAPPAAPVAAVAPEPEPPAEDEDEHDVLQLAREMFEAEVVGRSGQG